MCGNYDVMEERARGEIYARTLIKDLVSPDMCLSLTAGMQCERPTYQFSFLSLRGVDIPHTRNCHKVAALEL